MANGHNLLQCMELTFSLCRLDQNSYLFKSAMKIKSESYVVLFCQSSQTSLSPVFVMFRTEATIGGWSGTVVVRQPPRAKLKEVVVNWRG